MIPIYRIQSIMMRLLIVLILICSVGPSVNSARTYGLHPNDGGKLAPLPTRLVVGGLTASMGVAVAALAWSAFRRNPLRISFDPVQKQLHLDIINVFRDDHHVINLADIERIQYNESLESLGYSPIMLIWIKGWRWPIAISPLDQGVSQHPELMQSLLGRLSSDIPRDGTTGNMK